MILSDARALVAALKGRWHGHYGMARCPAHDDRTPSLSIAQGRSGPIFKCHAGCSFADIMRALRRGDIAIARSPRDLPVEPARPSYSLSIIERIWARAKAVGSTMGERYLHARGLRDDHRCLRFLAQCTYGPVRRPLVTGPALLVPMHHEQRLVGLQRIFLDPNDAEHFGRFKPVLCCDARASMQLEPCGSVLALTESAEDALAYTQLHGIPAWGVPGIEWLAHTAIPSAVDDLIIAFDRGCAARAAFDRHAERLAQGRHSLVFHPPASPAKDWNEQLLRGAVRMAA